MKFVIQSKSFGNRCVLGACVVEVASGQTVALLGPSGAGKSTLLRIIAGLEKDDAKSVQPSCRNAMVFQEPRLLPWKTVVQNVQIGGADNGWLEKLELQSSAHLFPRQLSLGMARRVALARALASDHDLLLLDEPFASLDPATSDRVHEVLQQALKHRDKMTILVTHDGAEARRLANRSYELTGSPSQLHQI